MNNKSLNQQKIAELRLLGDGDGGEFIREIFKTFINYTEDKLIELKKAIKINDAKSVASIGHAIKSSCFNSAAAKMGALCAEIEHLGKRDEMESALASFLLAEKEFEKVKREIMHLEEFSHNEK